MWGGVVKYIFLLSCIYILVSTALYATINQEYSRALYDNWKKTKMEAIKEDSKRINSSVGETSIKNPFGFEIIDMHFHANNFGGKWTPLSKIVDMTQGIAEKIMLMPINLYSINDHRISGVVDDPSYYLKSKTRRLNPDFSVDYKLMLEYLKAPQKIRNKFYLFLNGFEPMDLNAVETLKNNLVYFKGLPIVGIGEVNGGAKELVDLQTRNQPSLNNLSWDFILNFAEETGLLVMLHNDIDTILPSGKRPAYLDKFINLANRYPNATIILPHFGGAKRLGITDEKKRIYHMKNSHLRWMEEILVHTNNVYIDTSWDTVANWFIKDDEIIQKTVVLIEKYSNRFLLGSDIVTPSGVLTKQRYASNIFAANPIYEKLSEKALKNIGKNNALRILNRARQKVEDWRKQYYRENINVSTIQDIVDFSE